ncbi:DUF5009 domain-containing protein [Cyclobacterium sp. 1_MG-2023]|uniref:acyltransferase family protein n=1 Tax=Cyclobacterium sp. 1_MG-2023 TaxID=3062681 RepID=UPI0026E33842|nr:DUF5009 domain-containing protein [Cyclobacterium sp. 1_MG-2023]MDO6435826.1 DUF5009 domain-containing protein [Cyclobacterium sp. 1_MG-2023]
MTAIQKANKKRLVSLDAYRGITMFLLVGESARLYGAFEGLFPELSGWQTIFTQFTHHPWNGLRFWDLIQPFFMFIVGVAMPFSLNKRLEKKGDRRKVTQHILKRCLLLFLFGTGLHCLRSGALVFELWNVLTQLSFTILLTYFLINQSLKTQLSVSLALLLITELMYRLYDPSAPFVKGENFGSFVDLILMGKLSGGGWVAINCLPTAAHTLWGAMCGKILLSNRDNTLKIKYLVSAGLIGLVLGYSLDWSGITPIIKRICTSSFVLASGGWSILVLAFFFWLIDVKKVNQWPFMFIVVGMNSIFIYLFANLLGHNWLYDAVHVFNYGFFAPLGFPENVLALMNGIFTLAIMWYLCYFLYKKKLFFRI